MTDEAMALKCTCVGGSYWVRLRRWIPFPECRVNLTAGSMTAQHLCMHRTETAINWIQVPVIQKEQHP